MSFSHLLHFSLYVLCLLSGCLCDKIYERSGERHFPIDSKGGPISLSVYLSIIKDPANFYFSFHGPLYLFGTRSFWKKMRLFSLLSG